MIIFKKEEDLKSYLWEQKSLGRTIGFVPTMGALHAGHRSLVESARHAGNLVVCSVFVNPTQFNDPADFEKYPVTIESDIAILTETGCDVLFLPTAQEVYPDGAVNSSSYSFGVLDQVLEGAHRPGHFKGVGQVVNRLLEIVNPHFLYLGQKDYQQCMVISKLLEITGMHKKITLVICPTVREEDGLALSSRNVRLTSPQRTLAATIYQCLISIQGKQEGGDFDIVRKECIDLLRQKGFEPEYVSIADAETFDILDRYDPTRPTLALIAARIGTVRLIDNLLLSPAPIGFSKAGLPSDAVAADA